MIALCINIYLVLLIAGCIYYLWMLHEAEKDKK
jgi:flagellar basal body-associated protein FliL